MESVVLLIVLGIGFGIGKRPLSSSFGASYASLVDRPLSLQLL
jgi:hypothetical protein